MSSPKHRGRVGSGSLGPSQRPSWFSIRAFLGGFFAATVVGLSVLMLLLGVDAVTGSSVATDDDGTSPVASIAALIAFIAAYGLILGRTRD